MNEAFSIGSMTSGPLYKAVQHEIVKSLMQGEWKPGEAIPSEIRLAKRYQVSIGTLRKAIDDMVMANILIRHQGRGTFVATHNHTRQLYHFFHIVGPDGIKRYPDIELKSFTRGRASTHVSRSLMVSRNADVFRIINVVSLAGQPIAVDEITIPRGLFPGLTRGIVQRRDTTMYGLYQTRFAINVVHTKERLRARGAPARSAALLGLSEHTPILEIERTACTYNEQPVEFRISHVNTEKHAYFNDLL
jgi:GntR family transcriptional regulator